MRGLWIEGYLNFSLFILAQGFLSLRLSLSQSISIFALRCTYPGATLGVPPLPLLLEERKKKRDDVIMRHDRGTNIHDAMRMC